MVRIFYSKNAVFQLNIQTKLVSQKLKARNFFSRLAQVTETVVAMIIKHEQNK